MIKTKSKQKGKVFPILSTVLCVLLTVLSFVLFYAAKWYVDVYGQMGFDSVLYTLFSGLSGMDSGLIESFMGAVLPKTAVWSALICGFLFFRSKRKIVLTLFRKLHIRLYPFHPILSALLCLTLCICLLVSAAINVELDEYLIAISQMSSIFEDDYQDPKTTQITFPKEKRNLIYIFLESMEISYMSSQQNGMLPYNTIPELYDLAKDNVNFSFNEEVGGFHSVSGTNWTVGAMVAQTSGIPLKTPPGIDGNGYGQDGNFLPGVTTLTDILHENGYFQTLMVGSDATFGGRQQYYTRHNIDHIYDIHTARADGIIPENYYVWWGMEDQHLFEYAKQELLEIAAMGQPFAFTMLTVDTHHIDGYFCELCRNTYGEQYENVMACSSRQVAAFIAWLQQQTFYEDTTVVIVGDHPSMDNGYFQRNMPEGYARTVYNCILNPAVDAVRTTGRGFCAMDMFPTTLAAMGCTIQGDRLGLGTDLFSGTPTLLEELGYAAFNEQLGRTSAYYTQNFFFE